MAWWDKQENIDVLVQIANDLDKQYPDQKIVGIGHSPSWLVHTVAQIRMNEGRKHDTALVPFTGSFWGGSKAETDKETNHTVVSYKRGRYSTAPSKENITTYFNALSSRVKNVLSPAAQKPNNKIVLVDLIVSGDSFMSFADTLAEQNCRENFNDYYQAHIYKPYFDGGNATFRLIEEDGTARLSVDGHTQGRDAAYFLNGISGGKGIWSSKNSPQIEKTCGRFMPVYDPKSSEGPVSLHLDNRHDLKNIHSRIVNTVRKMDQDDVIARMKQSRETFIKKTPQTSDHWYYRGPSMHG